jgi:hypothetical protein
MDVQIMKDEGLTIWFLYFYHFASIEMNMNPAED